MVINQYYYYIRKIDSRLLYRDVRLRETQN